MKKLILFTLIFLLVSSLASQVIALSLDYHPALGCSLYGKFYQPWAWIIWTARYHQTHLKYLLTGHITLVISFGLIMWLLFAKKLSGARYSKSIDDLHGSAHWATQQEIKESGLLESGGVYVGAWQDSKNHIHYLRHNGAEHIIAFAPTRSGKGVGLVIPTLLSWTESAVVYDIKGENFAITSGWREQYANNHILCFDPSSENDSCAYNPLSAIRLDTDHAVGDAQNIAIILADPQGKGLETHWDKTAFSLLTGIILHALYKVRTEEGRVANLADVVQLLASPDSPFYDTLEEMLQYPHIHDKEGKPSPHPAIAQEARAMLNKAEEELSSIVSTAISHLSLYRDPIVAKNTHHSDFHIKDLMNHYKPVTLYIIDRPSDTQRFRPLMRLIITQIIQQLTERMQFKEGKTMQHYRHRLLLMLDEFPSLKRLSIMEDALAFMAGYGIKAYLICQDYQQLTAIYGRFDKIMGNCHIRIGYTPNTLTTAEMLSKMSGITTIIKEDINVSGSRFMGFAKTYNKSLREYQRPLITPDEVMRLPTMKKGQDDYTIAGEILVFVSGYPAIKGKQILYFQDKSFMERAKIPPSQAHHPLYRQATPSFEL